MRYLSVCSGIEAASAAWHPLGWTPHAFSEIEAFPSAVLAHHYGSNLPGEPLSTNAPPNYGDMTKFKEWPDANVDVLVGGTPCQSFSVAGLRKGLADPRGNLCLTFLAIADKYRPQWLLWENVPGVLSSDGGRDFGAFLGGLGQLGYGWSFRVLDAQYVRVDGFIRAVPQRRRRVFVVGHLGDWRRAAAVLFERESLCGDNPPRRQPGQRPAPTISARPTGGGGLGTDCDGGLIPTVSHCLNAGGMGRQDYETETVIAHALRADGFDASEDGTGRGTPIVPVVAAIQERAVSENPSNGPDGAGVRTDGASYTLEARTVTQAVAFQPRFARNGRGAPDVVASALTSEAGRTGKGDSAQCVAFVQNTRDEVRLFGGDGQTVGALAAEPGMKQQSYIANGWAVRRLMPIECERLQGFPDGYTDVPYRNKQAADGPRYKALGNSMAVNVMRWLGRRIELVNNLSANTHNN